MRRKSEVYAEFFRNAFDSACVGSTRGVERTVEGGVFSRFGSGKAGAVHFHLLVLNHPAADVTPASGA